MSDVVELSVALLRKYADFTKKLTPEQLNAIVNGELKFTLEVAKGERTRTSVDIEGIGSRLSQTSSREDAAAVLQGLTGDQLKALAKGLGVSLTGAGRVAQMRDRIVEHAVGFRLNSQTIREGAWR